MTKTFDENQYNTAFGLISAWGTAVEEARESDAALKALRDYALTHPDILKECLDCAELQQADRIDTSALPADDPASPVMRLSRIDDLRGLLGLDQDEFAL